MDYEDKIREHDNRYRRARLDGGHYDHTHWEQAVAHARRALQLDHLNRLVVDSTAVAGPAPIQRMERVLIPGEWASLRPEQVLGLEAVMAELAASLWRARAELRDLNRALAGGMVASSLPTAALLDVERDRRPRSRLTDAEVAQLIGEVVSFREAARRGRESYEPPTRDAGPRD